MTIIFLFHYICDLLGCLGNRCQNGGSCLYMKSNNAPKCSCVGGYTGDLCEEEPEGINFRPM